MFVEFALANVKDHSFRLFKALSDPVNRDTRLMATDAMVCCCYAIDVSRLSPLTNLTQLGSMHDGNQDLDDAVSYLAAAYELMLTETQHQHAPATAAVPIGPYLAGIPRRPIIESLAMVILKWILDNMF